MSEDEVLEALSAESGFAYLARKVDLQTAERIAALKLPGIGQLPDSRRTYPQGELASQVIGAVGIDNQGLTGLEAGEEEVLGGDDGERIDRQGRARRADPAGDGERRQRRRATSS